MPKSRLRPNHKQKVDAWKTRTIHAKRRYEKTMNELFMAQMEKLRGTQSGTTENNEPVQQTA